MQVAFELKDAGDIGVGIFVTRAVMKGAMIWRYSAGINVNVYDAKSAISQLEKFTTRAEARNFLDLTYGLKDLLHEIKDEGRFMNHSDTPNCVTDKNLGHTYAARDIDAGEQLFEDYTTFDHPDFLYDLLEKYQCAPDYYPLPRRENVEFDNSRVHVGIELGNENMKPDDALINGTENKRRLIYLSLNVGVLADAM